MESWSQEKLKELHDALKQGFASSLNGSTIKGCFRDAEQRIKARMDNGFAEGVEFLESEIHNSSELYPGKTAGNARKNRP